MKKFKIRDRGKQITDHDFVSSPLHAVFRSPLACRDNCRPTASSEGAKSGSGLLNRRCRRTNHRPWRMPTRHRRDCRNFDSLVAEWHNRLARQNGLHLLAPFRSHRRARRLMASDAERKPADNKKYLVVRHSVHEEERATILHSDNKGFGTHATTRGRGLSENVWSPGFSRQAHKIATIPDLSSGAHKQNLRG